MPECRNVLEVYILATVLFSREMLVTLEIMREAKLIDFHVLRRPFSFNDQFATENSQSSRYVV